MVTLSLRLHPEILPQEKRTGAATIEFSELVFKLLVQIFTSFSSTAVWMSNLP